MAQNPKSWRTHIKVVDQAIREQESRPDGRMAPRTSQRYDSTFDRLHRDHERAQRRTGGA